LGRLRTRPVFDEPSSALARVILGQICYLLFAILSPTHKAR
jgi:hypothetical protein